MTRRGLESTGIGAVPAHLSDTSPAFRPLFAHGLRQRTPVSRSALAAPGSAGVSYHPSVFLKGTVFKLDIFDAREPGRVHKSVQFKDSSKLIQQIRKDFEGALELIVRQYLSRDFGLLPHALRGVGQQVIQILGAH